MWRSALNTTVYATAMAYVETMIVVYLRRLYYPQGFDFPLVILDIPTLLLELQRETATMVMLVNKQPYLPMVEVWSSPSFLSFQRGSI